MGRCFSSTCSFGDSTCDSSINPRLDRHQGFKGVVKRAMEGDMVAKVKRETVVACMTCPLCDKLLRDATTISECLHTFCRKCIYEKITEDEIESCPVCDIDLGGTPLEKLR